MIFDPTILIDTTDEQNDVVMPDQVEAPVHLNAPAPLEPQVVPIQPQPIRRSERARKPTVFEGYEVYLQELEYDWGEDNDPITFKQATESDQYDKWNTGVEAEMKSMYDNGVWELVVPSGNQRAIGCKWVYKTKRATDGSIERHKARLVAKGFTQKEGIDYTETFSPVSTKDAFRIVMALVAHFNMELHQMDVKMAFINGELDEDLL